MEAHPELFFDYESSAALVRAYQEIAIKAGFCVRILHSEPGRPRLRLCCDRNGRSNSTRKQTLTKRVGCPYEILVRKHAITDKWRFVRRTGEHNHSFMAGTRFHRMTHAQREHRAQLHRDGMKIVSQVAFMRATYPTLLISYRDIVNEEARLKQLTEKQKQQQQHSSAEELEDGADGGSGDDGNADRGNSDLEDDGLDSSDDEEMAVAMPPPPMPQQQQQQQQPQGRHPSFTSAAAAATQHRHLSECILPTPTFQPRPRQQVPQPPRQQAHQPPPLPPPPRAPRFLVPSPLQQVLETLQAFSKSTGASDYVFTYKVEREPGGPSNIDRITHLFVAHRKSLELAREFHDVLSIELAKPKKLNKGMTLLLCTAKTPFKVPFLCAGVFIDTLRRREIFKPDYKWALDAIEGALCMESKGGYCVGDAVSVLIADTSDPKLLDAQKKTFPNASLIVSGTRTRKAFSYSWRQFFPHDQAVWDDMIHRWDAMCDAPTEDEFERQWEEFRAKEEFARVPGFLTYVEEKVLVNKEMFMEAWVNDRLHLGCVNTPLTDGPSHVFKKNPDSILKKFRPRYGVDLMKLWKEFDADIERQYWDVKRCHTDEESFRLVECDDHLYSKVTYRIASRALSLVHECITATQAWSQGREFTLQYSDKYFVSMGLPSFGAIRDRVMLNEPFELTDFHRFWLVERVDGSNELPGDLPLPDPSAGMPSAVPLSPFDEAILRLRERFFTVTPLMQAEILAQVNRITSTSAPSYPVPGAAAAAAAAPYVPLMGPRKRVRPSTATKISRGKVRQCSLCSQTGHNSRGCPIRDVFEESQEPVAVQPAAQPAAIAVAPPTTAASTGKRARTSTSSANQGKATQCPQCKQTGHNSRECPGFLVYEGIREEHSTSSRFIRPRHEKLKATKPSSSSHQNKQQEINSNNNSDNSSRLFYPGSMRETPGRTEKGSSQAPGRDVNSKFELAMQELNQIKGEYDLKQQRQNSAPALVFPHGGLLPNKISASTSNQARPTSVQSPYVDPSLQSAPSSTKGPETPAATGNPESKTTPVSAPEERNLNSPRQRLQVAEMVMRKLYRKNLQTEEQVAKLKEENAQLVKKMHQLEKESTVVNDKHFQPLATNGPEPEANRGNQGNEEAESASATTVTNNPAFQAFTCTSCNLQQQLSVADSIPSLVNPPTLESVTRLKTKSLYENPAQLNSSVRELLQLMEKKLAQIEHEHSQNLSLYNVKLYEVEQQTCESYVQKKMMEEEVQRIAPDVKQRDEVDVQIEQCMVGVFERLRQVEMENVLLKTTTRTATRMIPTGGQADISSRATT